MKLKQKALYLFAALIVAIGLCSCISTEEQSNEPTSNQEPTTPVQKAESSTPSQEQQPNSGIQPETSMSSTPDSFSIGQQTESQDSQESGYQGGQKIDPNTIPPPNQQMEFLLREMAKNNIKDIFFLAYDHNIWTIKTITPDDGKGLELTLNDKDYAAPKPSTIHVYKCDLVKKECALISTEKTSTQQLPPDFASLQNALRFVAMDNPNAIFRSVQFKDGYWVINAMIKYGLAMRIGEYIVDPTGSEMIRAADSADS